MQEAFPVESSGLARQQTRPIGELNDLQKHASGRQLHVKQFLIRFPDIRIVIALFLKRQDHSKHPANECNCSRPQNTLIDSRSFMIHPSCYVRLPCRWPPLLFQSTDYAGDNGFLYQCTNHKPLINSNGDGMLCNRLNIAKVGKFL